MKKHTTFALSLGLLVMGLLLVARVAHADFLLWLDGPSQKSGAHIAALTKTAEAKSGAHTSTPTYTPTASFSATLTQGATGSTDTFTVTPTPTNTTGTAPGTPGPVLYNDAIAGGNYTSACAGNPTVPGWSTITGGGATGDAATFLQLTVAASTAACYSVAGNINYGYTAGGDANTFDVTGSGLAALSFWFKVPSAGGCFNPGVCLVSVASGVQTISIPVTATSYIVGGPSFISAGTWYHVVIPYAAFEGSNLQGDTFTPAMLQTVAGVNFQPYFGSYDANGEYTGTLDVDNIQFVSTSVAQNPGPCAQIADFENIDGSGKWGTYWSAVFDGTSASAPCYTDTSTPPVTTCGCPGYSQYSSVLFPPTGTTSVVYSGDGDPNYTPCHSGRLAGYKGAYNGPYGTPACAAANGGSYPFYPYVNMTLRLNPIPPYDPANPGNIAPVDISNNTTIKTLPASGATGLKIAVKLGPNHQSGMAYKFYLNLKGPTDATTVGDGSDF